MTPVLMEKAKSFGSVHLLVAGLLVGMHAWGYMHLGYNFWCFCSFIISMVIGLSIHVGDKHM